MDKVLRKDLEYVLPKLTPEERKDPKQVLAAIQALIPGRKGGPFTEQEVEAALGELAMEPSKNAEGKTEQGGGGEGD